MKKKNVRFDWFGSLFTVLWMSSLAVVLTASNLYAQVSAESTDEDLVTTGMAVNPNLWDGTVLGHIWNRNSGNVGIGTASPSTKLEVIGAGFFKNGLGAAADDRIGLYAGDPNIGLELESGYSGGTPYLDFTTGDPDMGGSAGYDMRFQLMNSDLMAIRGGNVNIYQGSAPENRIALYPGDSNIGIELESGGYGGTPYIDFTTGEPDAGGTGGYDMRLQLLDSNSLAIRGGNVGIGTGTNIPSNRLEVNGTIAATGGNSNLWNAAYGWVYDLSGNLSNGFVASWDGGSGTFENSSIYISGNGNVGVATTTPLYNLHVAGTLYANEYICPAGDVAEKLPAHPDYGQAGATPGSAKEAAGIDPGSVVVITDLGITPCTMENDTRLAGVVSTQPALKMSSEKDGPYVALSGRVPCKVTGSIKAGDMLTTSVLEGHACRAVDPKLGAVVGKALEDFDGDSGIIEVWIGGL